MPPSTLKAPDPHPLVLLHLSDIHLSAEEIAGSQDLDVDIRKKLLADLLDESLPLKDGVDGILITGDIAYSAKTKEYESAHDWLKTLCAQIKCPASRVWVVPGNHDADWTFISKIVLDAHDVIREKNHSDRLREHLIDPAAAKTLLEPFANFNTFARPYDSRTQADAIAWESDELRLNDGSILRLRGINSALVSDRRDKAIGKPCQVAGEKQVQLRDDDDGVSYVTLCHHPPSWCHDEETINDHLINRAKLQLYGHDHRHRARQMDNSLVVFAGALHPERGEAGWEPRYNIMRLQVRPGAPRALTIDLFPRIWKPALTGFGPDPGTKSKYPITYELSLPPWQPPLPHAAEAPMASVAPPASSSPVIPMASSPREIIYGFFELSYPKRMKLLIELELLDDTDDEISDAELIRRAIKRATEKNTLEKLNAEIRKAINVAK